MPNPTLREIVETFTEEELSLTVPIEFQDVSADDYPYVNEYNRLLASAQTNADTDEGYDAFVAANEYRTANQEHIDKYVFDAKKLNILMTLVINAYMFAKGEKSATNTSYDNSMSGASSTNVQDALDECFQSVSDGKALVASAITDKKVPTDATATFAEMAENINSLKLGSGNAMASQVLSGRTFTNSDGVEYTGTMPNQGTKTQSLNCGGSYTIPAGYHNGSGKVTANSLKSQTSATAAAAHITKGYTAWVNGVKVTGTRPAITTTLSGTDKIYIYERYGTYYKIIKFSKQFDSPPKVTVAAGNPSSDAISFDSVTEGSFRAIAKNVNGVKGDTDAFTWTATGVTSS